MSDVPFTPFHIDDLELPSRVVMAPMTRSRSTQPGDVPNAMDARHHAQRASAAPIVSEATQIPPRGKGCSSTPGIHSHARVAGWRSITPALHGARGLDLSPALACGPHEHDGSRTDGMACTAGKIPNLVEMRAGPVAMTRPAAGLGERTYLAKGVDLELREMVVLRAAEMLGARRDAGTDGTMSRDDGHAPQEAEAAGGDLPVGTAPDCALVGAAVDELSEMGTLTHSTLRAMQGRFGDATIRTLVLIVGWFASTRLILDGCPAPTLADGRSARALGDTPDAGGIGPDMRRPR